MAVPLLLSEDHKVLESEFCSGYVDAFGKWNTGFFCPASGKFGPLFCCGITTFKYCCTGEIRSPASHFNKDDPLLLLVAVTLGIAAGISLLTLIACFVCPGCLLHNKRRSEGLPYSDSTIYGNGCSAGNAGIPGGTTISIGRCFRPFRSLYSLNEPLCNRTSWSNEIISPQVNQQQVNLISCSALQQSATETLNRWSGSSTNSVFTIPRPNVQARIVPVPADNPENNWSARSTIGRAQNMSNKFTMSTLI